MESEIFSIKFIQPFIIGGVFAFAVFFLQRNWLPSYLEKCKKINNIIVYYSKVDDIKTDIGRYNEMKEVRKLINSNPGIFTKKFRDLNDKILFGENFSVVDMKKHARREKYFVWYY